MAMLTLVVPGSGSDYADMGIGFFGELDLPLNPLAVLLPGTNFGATVRDQTGNGYDATVVGAPTRQPLYITGSKQNGLEIPLTGNALAASASAFTAIAVARAPAASNAAAVGTIGPLNTDTSFTLALHNSSLARMFSNAPSTFSGINSDAARGDRWGFYAGVVTPTSEQVFERHAGAATAIGAATSHASKAIGGAKNIRIAACYSDTFFPDAIDVAAVVLFARALTQTEIETEYAALSAFFATRGLAL